MVIMVHTDKYGTAIYCTKLLSAVITWDCLVGTNLIFGNFYWLHLGRHQIAVELLCDYKIVIVEVFLATDQTGPVTRHNISDNVVKLNKDIDTYLLSQFGPTRFCFSSLLRTTTHMSYDLLKSIVKWQDNPMSREGKT